MGVSRSAWAGAELTLQTDSGEEATPGRSSPSTLHCALSISTAGAASCEALGIPREAERARDPQGTDMGYRDFKHCLCEHFSPYALEPRELPQRLTSEASSSQVTRVRWWAPLPRLGRPPPCQPQPSPEPWRLRRSPWVP